MEPQDKQLLDLLRALAKAPAFDLVVCLSGRETQRLLSLLARASLHAAGFGMAGFGDEDRKAAVHLAMRLGIDPATGEVNLAPTQEEIAEQLAAEQRDAFLDGLMREGE